MSRIPRRESSSALICLDYGAVVRQASYNDIISRLQVHIRLNEELGVKLYRVAIYL
jgi:hypothetical protein